MTVALCANAPAQTPLQNCWHPGWCVPFHVQSLESGRCCAAEAGKPPTIPAVPATSMVPVALNPKKKLSFKLAEKHILSHNVRRYRFALPSAQHKFGLPVGKHVFLYAK